MNQWQLNAQTWNQDERRRYADAAADAASSLRMWGFTSLDRLDAAPAVLATLDSCPAAQDPTAPMIRRWAVEDLLRIPALQHFAKSPEVMMWAASWIGAPPKILDVSCWETRYGDAGDPGAQRWHRDMDDWRACKLFVYLTDVERRHGPHELLAGTHRRDQFIERGLPPDPFFVAAGREFMPAIESALIEHPMRVTFLGEAGTAWLENTYAFHRGTPVTDPNERRVVFQVLYGLMDLEKELGGGTKIPLIRKAWG